ncbi:DUF2243 domain-containing protein [Cytobacillus sp. S13-E01]|uniref:DUF2243 domain-containing protein n=1 Tax=Cytobacillus sp. S13-E01 TaxID=3031326 RepID=UPI0023D84C2B|nr:DUF2243 domain-containing protein [Cytobacillus sp. S13-E01]MDF0726332.1 DUF2243 domain-containing protein [Cytobacillus sp. S13-E01]
MGTNSSIKGITGSFVIGFGFLGALDGIIFHQLLQWHSVVMDTNRSGQIISDGIFNFAVTIALVVGGVLLWLAGKPTDLAKGVSLLIGGILIGGGAFNLIEGITNHHIFQIHRIKPGDPNAIIYDLTFLVLGVILIIIGLIVKRRGTSPDSSLPL